LVCCGCCGMVISLKLQPPVGHSGPIMRAACVGPPYWRMNAFQSRAKVA
jgi:hypothetical protein